MTKWNNKWANFHGRILIFMMVLSGCATPFWGYGENKLSREEFGHYVEDVFRLQNSITSEVMMLTLENDGDSTRYMKKILKAEKHMHEMCAPLNEYASRDSEGLRIGLYLRRQVERSAVDCERAARQVESLLKEL